MCSAKGVAEMAPVAATLARAESLQAHALAAECRLDDD
jgi:histidinol dehydrogenase